VGRQWLCEKLRMGEVSAITRAMRKVQGSRDARIKRMIQRLENLSHSPRRLSSNAVTNPHRPDDRGYPRTDPFTFTVR
jgi:hypothetical protein